MSAIGKWDLFRIALSKNSENKFRVFVKDVLSSQSKISIIGRFWVSALVVQWIECGSPKAKIRVRFSSGVLNGWKDTSSRFLCFLPPVLLIGVDFFKRVVAIVFAVSSNLYNIKVEHSTAKCPTFCCTSCSLFYISFKCIAAVCFNYIYYIVSAV